MKARSALALALSALSCCALFSCAPDDFSLLRPTSSFGPPRPVDRDAAIELPPEVIERDPPTCEEELGPPILRRLTSTQLRNSLMDLFGSEEVPDASFLADPSDHGYDVDAREAVIRDLTADQLMLYAESVAAWAVAERLEAFAPCSELRPLCRVEYTAALGRRLFRRPISNDTIAAYDTLAAEEAEEGDFETYARLVLTAMLQSPHFLYRMELGEPVEGDEGLVELGPWELASALSFLVTNSAPDEALLEAAGSGRLRTDEDLERELERLLATPRARQTLGRFVRQWLMVDDLPSRPKDPSVTSLTAAVRASMLRETEAFFVDVFESGGDFADLFEAQHTFVDSPLAAYYGLDPVSGEEMTRVELEGGPRAYGVLGQGSVLARHALADSSSPVQRGHLVRERFLCEYVAPPPSSVDTTLRPAVDGQTTRERYTQHTADPTCYRCHHQMDPIGFSLEHYDGFGRRREEESGHPIDATGVIFASADGDVALDGAESLSRYLAASPEARSCFARNLAYFAFGVEGCTYASVIEGFEADTPLRELLRRIVLSRHFRLRVAGE